MTDNLEILCQELDQLTIHMFELMEEQIKCKMRIEQAIKSSCLDLAKARYIMGNNNVSQLQLPTEDSENVTALKTVTSSVENKDKVECKTYRLQSLELENKQKTKEATDNKIRHRTAVDDGDEEPLDMVKERNGIISDPIKWFGFLVPHNLREAQKGFQRTLDLVIESANIQSELEAIRKKCVKLRQTKKKLEKIDFSNGKKLLEE